MARRKAPEPFSDADYAWFVVNLRMPRAEFLEMTFEVRELIIEEWNQVHKKRTR